jgi:anti-anti-sigma factor
MELDMQDAGNDVTKIVLRGRLDTVGVGRIETPFSAATIRGRHAVVDLSNVTFVASMGIRLFVMTGRNALQRGKKLILFGAQPPVQEVFEHAALAQLVAIVPDEATAMKATDD